MEHMTKEIVPWICDDTYKSKKLYFCSNCGCDRPSGRSACYCPRCGFYGKGVINRYSGHFDKNTGERIETEEYKKCSAKLKIDNLILWGYKQRFLDIISEQLTGSPLLMDVNYNIDHAEEDDLILYVTGDASEIIEIESVE